MSKYVTAETVSPGHPDKIADLISDYVLTKALENNSSSRVAVETFLTGTKNGGLVLVGGEISEIAAISTDDVIEIVKEALKITIKTSFEDFDLEIQDCDLFYCVTPYPLGLRSRLLDALNFGTAIITSEYDKKSLPFLEHNFNSYIAQKETDIGKLIIEIINDKNIENIKNKWKEDKSFYCGDALGRNGDWSNVDLLFGNNIGMRVIEPEVIFPIEIKENNVQQVLHNEMVIMIGFPGSGKSTFVKNNFSNYTILSGDELKTEAKIIKEINKNMSPITMNNILLNVNPKR